MTPKISRHKYKRKKAVQTCGTCEPINLVLWNVLLDDPEEGIAYNALDQFFGLITQSLS